MRGYPDHLGVVQVLIERVVTVMTGGDVERFLTQGCSARAMLYYCTSIVPVCFHHPSRLELRTHLAASLTVASPGAFAFCLSGPDPELLSYGNLDVNLTCLIIGLVHEMKREKTGENKTRIQSG